MGISVEGQKCPVCGAYIFDNDDLVFCPECGAPHHRDCYEVLGHCAYADKHGTADAYNPEAEKQKAEKERAEKEKANQGSLFGDEPPFEEQTTPCRFCGEPLFKDERVCHKCGRPQMAGGPGAAPFGAGAAFAFDPLGGVPENEVIGEVTAKEIKNYVAINTQRYVPRFKGMVKEKRNSWNWAAFLLPEAWFFYRKMYFPGIFVTILRLIASLFLFPFSEFLGTLPIEETASPMLIARYLTNNMESILNQPVFYMAIGGLLLNIILRIVCGLVGDKIYFKAVTEGIKSVKSSEEELETPIETALARKGSVNSFLGLITLFGFDILVSLVQILYISVT